MQTDRFRHIYAYFRDVIHISSDSAHLGDFYSASIEAAQSIAGGNHTYLDRLRNAFDEQFVCYKWDRERECVPQVGDFSKSAHSSKISVAPTQRNKSISFAMFMHGSVAQTSPGTISNGCVLKSPGPH